MQKEKSLVFSDFRCFLVIPLGLEPKTHSLEGCCSIQLSYGTDLRCEIGCKGKTFL